MTKALSPGISRVVWLRATLAAGALALMNADVARAQGTLLPIRIGASRNEATGAAFYAADLGLFEKTGLAADVQTLQNGPAIAAAVAGGSLDVGAGSPFAFMNARRHGLPFTIVAPGALYESTRATVAMTVPAASPVRTARDLNGRTIGAITVGGLDQLSILAWLDQNGGDSKTVQVIEVPLSTMADAMDAGRLSAALLQEPQLSAAGSRVRSIGKPYDAIAPRFMISVWFGSNAFIEKQPAATRRFAQAIIGAAGWANANPAKAAVSIEKWTNIRESTVLTVNGETLDAGLLQPICELAWKYKMIEGPMNARDFLWQG